jgi:DNA mismatch repair protein MutS2
MPYFAKISLLQLYPPDLAEALDFPFIQTEVAKYCSTKIAKEQAFDLKPNLIWPDLQRSIAEGDQVLALLLGDESFPTAEHPSLIEFLSKLKVRGHALREEQFADIRSTVLNYRHLFNYVEHKVERLPALWDRVSSLEPDKFIWEAIDKVLDERATVRSSASPELSKIRRDLSRKRASADRIFNRMLKKYRDKGYIADFDESVSESRRVLAIQASFKGQIQGILHGSSNKRNVSYIEPGETVEMNNEISELIEAELEEIKRILRELSSTLSPYHDHILSVTESLVWLDFTRAKALFARAQEACYPEIVSSRQLKLREAFNPVLRHFNKEKRKPTVALDLDLDLEKRILVISGPNAGGKSLSLKTVGLLQMMLQCGLAIPVHADSKFCLFEQLLGDIGDAQSIENELSTYSSKLQKMEHFLTYTDSKTLLLIDEFGSGSDPELGSALAQVFLDRLNAYGAFGIMTTHFNSIKALAAKTAGVVNGAMLFDQKNFDPRYTLQIGQPGSSYTFEVAQRSGIPTHLIEDARGRVSQNTLEVDKLLVEIQQDKIAIEKARKTQEAELLNLRKLERIQEDRIKQLEEKLTKHSRLNEEQDRAMYWGQRFKKLIDTWMDQKGPKDKKAIVARFIAILNQRAEEVQKEDKVNHRQEIKKHHKDLDKYLQEDISAGMEVKIIDSGIKGSVIGRKGEKYIVALGGNMTATLERVKIVRATANLGEKPKKKQRRKKFNTEGNKQDLEKDSKVKAASAKAAPSSKNNRSENKGAPQKPAQKTDASLKGSGQQNHSGRKPNSKKS